MKNKRLWILSIVTALIVFLLISVVIGSNYSLKEIKIDEYLNYYKDSNTHLVFVKEKGKTAVKEFENVVKQIDKKNKLEIKSLNLSELTKEEKIEFMQIDPTTADEYTVPMLILIKDNKIVDLLMGYNTKEEVIQFLRINELIEENNE